MLKGGITNRLFVCRMAPYPPVIVRLFGRHSSAVINRVSELQVAKFISRNRVGPSIFGSFTNGRLEGFLDGAESLTPAKMLDRQISSAVAVSVAALHSLRFRMPSPEEPVAAAATASATAAAATAAAPTAAPSAAASQSTASTGSSVPPRPSPEPPKPVAANGSLWTTIESWLSLAIKAEAAFEAAGDADRLALYRSLDLPRVHRELVELRALLLALDEPLVFCHNDLLSGNILHTYDEHGVPTVTLIDFEYGAINFRAFDIANHFCECSGFDCDWRQFPDEDHQRNFIRTYLRAADLYSAGAATRPDGGALLSPTTPSMLAPPPPPQSLSAGALSAARSGDVNTTLDADAASLSEAAQSEDPVLEARVEVLRRRVMGFVLAAHLFWGSWSVVMSLSTGVAFDYLGYAALRLKGYYYMRTRGLLAVKPVLQAKATTATARDGRPVAARVAPVRAVVVGWGLAGRDLHPPALASAAGIVLKGAVVRPRGEDATADAERAAAVRQHVVELHNHFGEAGVPIDAHHFATVTEADALGRADTQAPCRAAAPCALSAREQDQFDGLVTAHGVAWDMRLLTRPAALSVSATDALAASAGVSLSLSPSLSLSLSTASYSAAAEGSGDGDGARAGPVSLADFSTAETFDAAREATVYPSLQAALADPSVELVVIASPPDTHAAYAQAALRAGKHVVLDKPFVPTVAEAEALAGEAARAGRVLTVFQNRRFDGDAATLRSLLKTRALGRVRWAEFAWNAGLSKSPEAWKRGANEAGCGRLWDLGAHCLDHALTVFRHARRAEPGVEPDEPEAAAPVPASVYARILREDAAAPDTDTHAQVTVTFSDGSVAVVDVGAFVAVPKPKMLVVGDVATFAKHGMDTQEHVLVAGRALGVAVEPKAEYGTLRTRAGVAEPVPTLPGRWTDYYQAVVAAVRGGAAPPVSLADSVTSVAVTAAAIESARTGQAVAVKNYHA